MPQDKWYIKPHTKANINEVAFTLTYVYLDLMNRTASQSNVVCKLLNDRKPTRTDPATRIESILDLSIRYFWGCR